MKRKNFAMSGTLMVASMSALFLVSGCGSSGKTSAFAGSAADKATEQRLAASEAMPALQPFDEQFVVLPTESSATP
jgi:hypothetical protein